jgi:ABC-type nitrate/sulfonate/bicarbonate transport system permease component
MIGRLAPLLGKVAVRLLPAPRKPWGAAMEAELRYIGDERAAIGYAAGCLIAAIQERARDFETRFSAGLWSIAAVSAAFALFHIYCATRGVQVLLGSPDGFLDSLVRSGRADAALIASYQSAMPIVIACLFALGAAHLAAAYCLVRRRFRGFLVAWCSALGIAAVAVAIQLSIVWTGDELPSEFFALLIQATALSLLVLWSNGELGRSRRQA